MYFFKHGLGYMKGNATVYESEQYFFCLENSCVSDCSIVLFPVLDRCLIAC